MSAPVAGKVELPDQRGRGSQQESLQAGEGSLPVLAEREGFVGLERLEPGTKGELMPPPGEENPIFQGEKITRDPQVASVVAACQTYLRLRIGRRAAAHNDSTNRMPDDKTRGHRPPACRVSVPQ